MMDYGDDYLDEITPPRRSGPRHAAPRPPRRKLPLVHRLIRWAIVYAVLYAVAAVVLALHPPTMHLYFPAEPTPSASVTHDVGNR